MRLFAILFSLLTLTSCCCSNSNYSGPLTKVVESSEMTWIVQKIATKWRHEEGRRLKLEHSHVNYNPLGFNELEFEFSSQEILEIEQARNLLVDLTEDILKAVNTNPIVSGQINENPYSADSVHIEINFESYFGEYVDPFYVGCIELKEGMAYYYAFDMKDQEWFSWHSRVEPYVKSREVSILSRTAEKEFDDAHPCPRERLLDELFQPAVDRECQYKRRL